MKQDIAKLVPDYDRIIHCTDAKWIALQLEKQLTRCAAENARLAVLLLAAKRLGIKTRVRGCTLLYKIARGELSAHLYTEYEHAIDKVRVVSRLKSIKAQEQIADGKPLRVAVEVSPTVYGHVPKTLQEMTLAEVRRTFPADGTINPPETQIEMLKAEKKKAAAKAKPSYRFHKKGLTVGNLEITNEQMIQHLRKVGYSCSRRMPPVGV